MANMQKKYNGEKLNKRFFYNISKDLLLKLSLRRSGLQIIMRPRNHPSTKRQQKKNDWIRKKFKSIVKFLINLWEVL